MVHCCIRWSLGWGLQSLAKAEARKGWAVLSQKSSALHAPGQHRESSSSPGCSGEERNHSQEEQELLLRRLGCESFPLEATPEIWRTTGRAPEGLCISPETLGFAANQTAAMPETETSGAIGRGLREGEQKVGQA